MAQKIQKKEQLWVFKKDKSIEVRVLYEDYISVFYESVKTQSRFFSRREDFLRDYTIKTDKKTYYYLVVQRIRSEQVYYNSRDMIITSLVHDKKDNPDLESYRNNPNYRILQECEITVEIG